ncbi:MAG: methylated-DNA--[protein]-cysteine S-methyltransferase [Gammaproteobacteria bacterium]|nr:methylated-DNA--[protein]-cysteine S-methyltransferase [Gammaproteobacteria bacterium]
MPKRIDQLASEVVVIQTPFSKLALEFESGLLVSIDLFSRKKLSSAKSDEVRYGAQQVKDYCAKQLPDFVFDIALDARGTLFQKKVWQALQKIPAGEVMTYGELAKQLNTSARAVGNACRANPIPLVIPCHRVVSKSGMGGFAGSRDGLPMKIKSWLLAHENLPV